MSIAGADNTNMTLGASAVIDQSNSIGFTQVDAQADAAQRSCSRYQWPTPNRSRGTVASCEHVDRRAMVFSSAQVQGTGVCRR